MPFRDLIVDHRPLLMNVTAARRAVGKFYRAVSNRQWTTAHVELLVAMAELRQAYDYIEALAE